MNQLMEFAMTVIRYAKLVQDQQAVIAYFAMISFILILLQGNAKLAIVIVKTVLSHILILFAINAWMDSI